MGKREGTTTGRWKRVRPPADIALLLFLSLWMLGVGYGLRDPWPADEPRFALIGQDIVESGNWWVPHRGPELYAEKPPIFLWMQAAAYVLTGQTRTAFLLPSLLAALGVLGLTWDLLRRLHGRRIAFYGSLALLFTVQFTLQGRTAQIDMVLACFTTLGLYGILRHLIWGPSWHWYVIAGISTGIGVITKGTGFLPWLILLPYAFARWRGMDGLAPIRRDWRWSWGPLAMLLPILAWAVPLAYFASLPGNEELAAYRDDLFFRQTVTRYANAWGHIKPFWYFFVEAVPTLWIPLVVLFPWAIPAWVRRIRRGHALPLLMLSWVLMVLVFFSLSPGKRGVYILPALPALVIAIAPMLPGLLRKTTPNRVLRGLAILIALILVTVPIPTFLGDPGYEQDILARHQLTPWTWLFMTGLLASIAVCVFWRRGTLTFVTVVLSVWTGYGLLGFPNLDGDRSARDLMQKVHTLLPAHSQVGIIDGPEQLLLQAEGNVRSLGFRTPVDEQLAKAETWLQESPDHWIMIQSNHHPELIDFDHAIEAGFSNRRQWHLVNRNSFKPSAAFP